MRRLLIAACVLVALVLLADTALAYCPSYDQAGRCVLDAEMPQTYKSWVNGLEYVWRVRYIATVFCDGDKPAPAKIHVRVLGARYYVQDDPHTKTAVGATDWYYRDCYGKRYCSVQVSSRLRCGAWEYVTWSYKSYWVRASDGAVIPFGVVMDQDWFNLRC